MIVYTCWWNASNENSTKLSFYCSKNNMLVCILHKQNKYQESACSVYMLSATSTVLFFCHKNTKVVEGKETSSLFSHIGTSESHIPHVSVCVIALHSQMPLKIFDPLTNSPFSALSSWQFPGNVHEEEEGTKNRQRAGPDFPDGLYHIDWWVKYISNHIKNSSRPCQLFGEKTLDFPEASRKQIRKEHCLRGNVHALKPS